MKGFNRRNQLFSLCGLNCGLCPMFLNKNCPGCGAGEGNQSCKIARCSMEHDSVEYCFQCSEYPCEKYENIDNYDSFITHQNQKSDLYVARRLGIDVYNSIQKEKAKILDMLLSDYNDGRKKTFFCVAVNLLDLQGLHEILAQIEDTPEVETWKLKEKSRFIAELLQEEAEKNGISLKLRRKSDENGKEYLYEIYMYGYIGRGH